MYFCVLRQTIDVSVSYIFLFGTSNLFFLVGLYSISLILQSIGQIFDDWFLPGIITLDSCRFYFSTLNIEAVLSSENLINFY
jgi:hypothetical protein